MIAKKSWGGHETRGPPQDLWVTGFAEEPPLTGQRVSLRGPVPSVCTIGGRGIVRTVECSIPLSDDKGGSTASAPPGNGRDVETILVSTVDHACCRGDLLV